MLANVAAFLGTDIIHAIITYDRYSRIGRILLLCQTKKIVNDCGTGKYNIIGFKLLIPGKLQQITTCNTE